MNKIFKVVWNKSKNCYVVVSEFAKNNSGKKKIVVAGIFAALAMTNANVALAVNDVPTGASATAVAFGNGATVTGANAVGLGKNVKASNNDVVVIGTDAKAETAGGGVAIGQNAYSKGLYGNTPSVAVGKNSIANGGTAIAVGTYATVNEVGTSFSQGIAIGGGALPGQGATVIGDQAIAIGGNTKAFGHSSIVIGGDDADRMTSTKAVYTDITTGKAAVATVSDAVKALTGYEIKWRDYNNATADHIGITVGTKGQSGNAGIAIGTGADSKNRIAGALNGVNTSGADNNSVTNAIAIGTGAKANRDNSVALGGGSTTDKAGTKQTSYTLPTGVTATWSGGESTLEGDVVSFGAEGFERQLKNVAPGEVSATSTDAINGSQLAAIADQIALKYVSINSTDVPNKDNTGAKANNSIAIGPNASTDTAATSSVAIGDGANATGRSTVALGLSAQAKSANATAVGANSIASEDDTVAVGHGAKATDGNASALGADAIASNIESTAIGHGTAASGASSTALGSRAKAAGTAGVGIGMLANATKDYSIAIGGESSSTADNSIAIGRKSSVSENDGIAIGTRSNASAVKSIAIGDGASATTADGVAIGSKSVASTAAGVAGYNANTGRTDTYANLTGATLTSTLGGVAVGTTGQTRQINYVAAGTADTDAVNVAQLKSVNLAFTGDTGSGDVNLANSKLAVNGDDTYITTTANGKKITIAGKKQDITVTDGTAAATPGMADSANVADAINKAIDQNKYGWNLSANGEATPEAIEKGNTVDFSGDDNITVARNNKNISVSLKKNLTGLNSASFNNAAGNPTVKIDGDKGINAGDMKVTNVADGVDDKDAVNVSQLKKTDDKAEANKAAIARKISLGGNTGSTREKSLSTGDVKFNVKGANGLTTVAAGEDVTVQLDTDTKNKIDNAADKDLSNLTPDGKKQVKDLAAWNVVANNGTAEKVLGGDTVKYINGDNILITQSGKDFTFATKPDVTFNTVTANDTITAPKVKATTGVETPQVTGLTNKTWDPNNITSGRAATEDQLKAVDDQVKANKDNITQNAGDIATNKTNIAKNAGDIADNKTAINKNAGDIANNAREIAANKDKIDQNTTAIARKISLGSDDGDTDEKSLSTGDVKFNIKGENGITTAANGVDVTVKLDDATKDKIDNAANKDLSNLTPAGKQQVKDLAAWNVVANNGTAEKVQGGDTVKFIDGDNVSITQNGKEFTVATKKDVTFDNVTANQKITAPEVSGLTNTTWVPGQTTPVSGRAATEDQLKAVDDQVTANKANITKNADAIKANKDNIAANKEQIDKNTTAIARKISLGGNTGSTDEKSLSTGDVKFNIKGQNGIVTEANGDDVTVKLDDDTANKINNAANTDLSNLTDAGKQQVKDLSAWNVVANNGTAEKVEGGNTVKFIDGDNISITQNGKDFTIATKKDVTFDTVTANDTITAPKVKATDGVETPEVTGLTNKTWVPGQTQPVSGRAATEDQLKAVDDQVEANKANITKNAGDIAANKAQIDKNTEAIGRKISLGGNTGSTDEKSLSTGDVKFNIKGENGLTTVANGEDVTVKIDDATKAKIDNAANQDLSNLTPAGKQQVKDLSAWNVTAAGGTVEKVQGGDTVKFQAGDNLEVKQDGTTFTYSLAKDVKGLNSVTVGDENGPSTKITPAGTTVKDAAGNATTVNGAGMTINPANSAASPVSLTVDGLNNGGNQIHGVAPGTADTDAVNVSQLKETKAGLQQAINNVGVETQRVGAHAAAMAALKPIQYDPLEPTQIMAGIGNYRGETAGAIGLAHYKTEDTMFNIGVTLGSSHNMINAGVTHKFGGSRDRKDAIPERYKAGPISSIYVMQDEVSHLRSQNEEYKSKLEQQQSEIDALKAAVNQLLTNKA